MKKKPATKNTFTASQVGTLLESLRSDFHVLAENQRAMDEKFTGKFNLLFEEMGRQREDIWALKADVRILKEDVRILKDDVSVLKEDVRILKDDVSVLKEDMKIVKTNIVEIKDTLKGQDKRIDRLEAASVK